jgi:carbon monoxide dehydrogenase subunit G
MSPCVRETIDIDATPEEVWDVVMDPARLGDWVSAHRKVTGAPETPLDPGDSFDQVLNVAGKSFEVEWKLLESDRAKQAVWEAEGPRKTHADVRYELKPQNGGTRFDYVNDFSLPGGPLKAVANGISGRPAKLAARKSLKQLKKLLENGG